MNETLSSTVQGESERELYTENRTKWCADILWWKCCVFSFFVLIVLFLYHFNKKPPISQTPWLYAHFMHIQQNEDIDIPIQIHLIVFFSFRLVSVFAFKIKNNHTIRWNQNRTQPHISPANGGIMWIWCIVYIIVFQHVCMISVCLKDTVWLRSYQNPLCFGCKMHWHNGVLQCKYGSSV